MCFLVTVAEAETPAGAIDLTSAIGKNETPGGAAAEPVAAGVKETKKEKE